MKHDMLIEVMGSFYDGRGTTIKGIETGDQHRMVELHVAQKIDLPNDPTGVRMGISNPAIENTSAGHIRVSSDQVGVVPPVHQMNRQAIIQHRNRMAQAEATSTARFNAGEFK